MNPQGTTTSSPNGETAAQELFALTDEQILEIEPAGPAPAASSVILSQPAARGEAQTASSPSDFGAENLSSGLAAEREQSKRDSSVAALPQNDRTSGVSQLGASVQQGVASATEHASRNTAPGAPPKWLADMMDDPQAGAEARDLWSGVQQARQEASAFREVFAKPEEARAAAERARTLEEIDAAFYGGAGKSPGEISAARAALAQRLLREDPAAFREMVFAGLRALEETAGNVPTLVPAIQATRQTSQDSPTPDRKGGGPSLGMTQESVSAYREFERAANEELERSVGGAIERALAQALPNARGESEKETAGARYIVPLQQRLSTAIRQEIEAALKDDRQLGEQVAQVLASRRFDEPTRAQVVRLINDRAQQLVPVAAKRVIDDWTQATLAAHRSRLPAGQAQTQRAASGGDRSGLAPADVSAGIPPLKSGNIGRASGRSDSSGARAGRIDYRKLTDEQILNL